MSRGSEPQEPMPKRLAWQLVGGGVAGIVGGAALGMTIDIGFLGLSLLSGLAFTLGLCGLAERAAIALPAFVIGLGAPLVLTFGGHSVLLDQTGHVEHCVVKGIGEHRSAKRPTVDYLLACPSGEVELSRDLNDRLMIMEADARTRPPLRPLFASPDLWNLPTVLGVLVVMIAAVPVARLLRQQP